MAADHHRIAAVLRPRTFKLSRKIAPAPREPTPDSTCAATPRVLTCVVEAWAKATQVKIDASRLTASVELKQFQEAQNQPSGAWPPARGKKLSRPQAEPELPGVAIATRGQMTPITRRGGTTSTRAYNTELK